MKDGGGDEGAYKDSRAGGLLLNCTDVLQSDHEKLRSIDRKLQVKCEDQKTSMVAEKEDRLPDNGVSDTAEQLTGGPEMSDAQSGQRHSQTPAEPPGTLRDGMGTPAWMSLKMLALKNPARGTTLPSESYTVVPCRTLRRPFPTRQ